MRRVPDLFIISVDLLFFPYLIPTTIVVVQVELGYGMDALVPKPDGESSPPGSEREA